MNILTYLDTILDTRQETKVIYDLSFVILFSIMAICSEASTFRRISTYFRAHFIDFKEKFNLTWERTPAYTTIRDILNSIEIEVLENAFRSFSMSQLEQEIGLIIHVDGKVLRGSKFKDQPALQVLNAFVSNKNIIIGHKFIEENKTNEIPKAQEIIKELTISDALFTFDALHTQRKTMEVITQTKNNSILQIKGNQKSLLKACINRSKVARCKNKDLLKEISHGRAEIREISVYKGFCSYNKKIKKDWNKIKEIVKVKRTIDSKIEISYYISTYTKIASEYQYLISDHWKVENTDHYVRDVALREDKSKIHIGAKVFAILRSFAFNVLNLIRQKNQCITDLIYFNSQNPSFLLNSLIH